MLKNIASAALAAGMLCAPALAHAPRAVPSLSGSYVYSGAENCPSGGGSIHQVSGTLTFDPASGKARLDAYFVTGDAPEILRVKSTQDYTNSAAAFSLAGNSYHITYGPVQGGVAAYASFIGLVQDGTANCGFQGTITLQ